MNIRNLLPLLFASLFLASCGAFGGKKPEYYDVTESKDLMIPENLDTPTSPTALTVDRNYTPLPANRMSAVPPRVIANQKDDGSTTRLQWSADGVYILVEDSADSVQRRLKFVIERSGMAMRSSSSNGNYRFGYEHEPIDLDEGFFSKLAFWRDEGPDYSGDYETVPQADGDRTRVYLKYADGGEVPMDAAEHVLVILMERLG